VTTTWVWVIVFGALALLALIAVAACAWPVWKAFVALTKQFGRSAEAVGEAMEPLAQALEQPGLSEGSSRRR